MYYSDLIQKAHHLGSEDSLFIKKISALMSCFTVA